MGPRPAKFGRSMSNGMRVIKEIRLTKTDHRVPSSKVI